MFPVSYAAQVALMGPLSRERNRCQREGIPERRVVAPSLEPHSCAHHGYHLEMISDAADLRASTCGTNFMALQRV